MDEKEDMNGAPIFNWQSVGYAAPRPIPSQPMRWPGRRSHIGNQIQQIKVASQPTALSNTNAPSTQQVPSINMPQHVSNVSVSRTSFSDTHFQVQVKFQRNPADPHFQKANVYLRTSGGTSLVTSGNKSPITFITPKSNVPTSIVVQSEGNWGANPIERSPARAISLSHSVGGAQTVNAGAAGGAGYTPSPTPPPPPTPTPPTFDQIGSGTNKFAQMTVGGSAVLSYINTGIVDASDVSLLFTAGENIPAFQAVSVHDDGFAYLADADTSADCGRVVGVAMGSVMTGDIVRVQEEGILVNSGYMFATGAPIFLGLSGALTDSPSLGVFGQQIGVISDAGTLVISLGLPTLFA